MRVFFVIFILFFFNCQAPREAAWQSLFNEIDLSGWDTYLGPAFDTTQGKFDTTRVPGLNMDIEGIFSVVTVDDHPAIRISGKHFGGISTQESFENYHLKLEFKWGEARWAPNDKKKRDSGLLYHAVGDHGADYGFWMRSQEFQIQEGDCGDYWGVAGGVMDIPATGDAPEKFVYNPASSLVTFSGASSNGRRCIKMPDSEKPTGEWNTVDLYCHGDTAVHVMNGKVVMVLFRSRQADNGVERPLTAGKIQLQSEGAEVFFRRIQIEHIAALPREIVE